jgi:hypothetical protein
LVGKLEGLVLVVWGICDVFCIAFIPTILFHTFILHFPFHEGWKKRKMWLRNIKYLQCNWRILLRLPFQFQELLANSNVLAITLRQTRCHIRMTALQKLFLMKYEPYTVVNLESDFLAWLFGDITIIYLTCGVLKIKFIYALKLKTPINIK